MEHLATLYSTPLATINWFNERFNGNSIHYSGIHWIRDHVSYILISKILNDKYIARLNCKTHSRYIFLDK